MEVAGEGVDSPRRSREGYSKDVVYSVNVRGQGTVSSSWMAYPRNGEARGPAGSWPLQGTVAMVRKGVKVFGGEVHSEGSQREMAKNMGQRIFQRKDFFKKSFPLRGAFLDFSTFDLWYPSLSGCSPARHSSLQGSQTWALFSCIKLHRGFKRGPLPSEASALEVWTKEKSRQTSCGHSQSHESSRLWAPQRCVPGRPLGF